MHRLVWYGMVLYCIVLYYIILFALTQKNGRLLFTDRVPRFAYASSFILCYYEVTHLFGVFILKINILPSNFQKNDFFTDRSEWLLRRIYSFKPHLSLLVRNHFSCFNLFVNSYTSNDVRRLRPWSCD